ncbi:LSM domain-containing protein [Picrophilus oshimae]|uniref:Putative snRNP Sm-like protein n=1 Tax=Picrophilus torridus (strain ATCC 700027 / DSM 9790 / JCM 10055 / NBRC 100828 / KAW 2/3) TaxID=1122961 RepID=Q6L197_PICTO|nr:LSM domain-containing protein [Picrophilus oshimae]AAT43255.1 snRNP Sm-like protein [Picrophilus oshimae DSM 9789]SMD30438.1 Small nuclear ribonucleoprotein, LSM family [Picrophilus oshimae DSM 9789]
MANKTAYVSKPMDVLKNSLEKNIMVDVKGNRTYSGTLEGYDIYMNVVLSNVSETINGENKGVFEKMLVRGDNIIFVSPSRSD